eukprot:c44258_g1_i1 orf=28-288(+)
MMETLHDLDLDMAATMSLCSKGNLPLPTVMLAAVTRTHRHMEKTYGSSEDDRTTLQGNACCAEENERGKLPQDHRDFVTAPPQPLQ